MPPIGYVLNENNEPVPEPDQLKVALFLGSFQRRIVAQHEIGESFVSTVFLVIDPNFRSEGPPVLFETLVQGGPLDAHTERYTTWSEAVAGHVRVLRLLGEKLGVPFTDVAKSVVNRIREHELRPHRRTIYERIMEDD